MVTADIAATPVVLPDPKPAPPRPALALRVADMSWPVPQLPGPRPGQPMTSLFGILGLLLIPVAGAALGYRQARAARSVGSLPRT